MKIESINFAVKVTLDDILIGEQGGCESCPVALALNRATGEIWLIARQSAIHLATGYRFDLPERIQNWIGCFDRCSDNEIMARNPEIDFEIAIPIYIFPDEIRAKLIEEATCNTN